MQGFRIARELPRPSENRTTQDSLLHCHNGLGGCGQRQGVLRGDERDEEDSGISSTPKVTTSTPATRVQGISSETEASVADSSGDGMVDREELRRSTIKPNRISHSSAVAGMPAGLQKLSPTAVCTRVHSRNTLSHLGHDRWYCCFAPRQRRLSRWAFWMHQRVRPSRCSS